MGWLSNKVNLSSPNLLASVFVVASWTLGSLKQATQMSTEINSVKGSEGIVSYQYFVNNFYQQPVS